jgi:hypothetical protein
LVLGVHAPVGALELTVGVSDFLPDTLLHRGRLIA